jgi:flagellin-like protein
MMVVNKKAEVGIGTLIVFIAMILAAAVAAGVIIRTSGILQERAFAVGGEARQRLVTGLEVLQVVGTSDLTTSTIPQIEILVRTRSGSGPVQLRTLGLSYSTQNVAFAAELQHPTTEKYNEKIDGILNSTWFELDFDMNRDYLIDSLRYTNNSEDKAVLQFDLSGFSLIEIPLEIDFTGTNPRNISISEFPIIYLGIEYGFVDVEGQVTTDGYLNLSEINLTIRQFPEINVCNFDKLISEKFFCFESRLGNTDTVLQSGELYVLKFKLSSYNQLTEEETFQFTFMPKDGSTTYLEAASPNVIGDTKMLLWPS